MLNCIFQFLDVLNIPLTNLESLGRRYNKTVNPIPDKLIKSFEIREWNVENVKELEDAVKRYILGQ